MERHLHVIVVVVSLSSRSILKAWESYLLVSPLQVQSPFALGTLLSLKLEQSKPSLIQSSALWRTQDQGVNSPLRSRATGENNGENKPLRQPLNLCALILPRNFVMLSKAYSLSPLEFFQKSLVFSDNSGQVWVWTKGIHNPVPLCICTLCGTVETEPT